MEKTTKEYVHKALSQKNRKTYDGDSNAPYKIVIKMAEVGSDGHRGEAGFLCRLTIPRQSDNELGCSLEEDFHSREEAISLFEELITELKSYAT